MKICKDCGKPKKVFWSCKTSADGKRSYCSDCGKQKRLDYYYKNKKSLLVKNKIYRESHKKQINDRLEKNSEERKVKRDSRYAKNKKQILGKQKAYNDNHKEEKRVYDASHYESNKELRSAQHKLWVSKNRQRVRELSYLRKRRLRIAMLKGVEEQILEFYRNRPEGYHIDHIIPLNHPQVCGLHVPWNLQYLPAEENMSKGNKVDL